MPCHPEQSCRVAVVSKSVVYPDKASALGDLQLTVPDLSMLCCHYIQKGLLYSPITASKHSIIQLLKISLSKTLSYFPPLAGRLATDSEGRVRVICNDAGAQFIHANGSSLSVSDVLIPARVPDSVDSFFAFPKALNYSGHQKPLLVIQVTELNDGVFIGCTVNHAVVDGTSLWNFFNTFAEVSRGFNGITRIPDFSRHDTILASKVVLRFPPGGPKVTFNDTEPLSQRIFTFSGEAVARIKYIANRSSAAELMQYKGKKKEISSFQSLCALLWRAVTRARKLNSTKTTTFRMAMNIRHRLAPSHDPYYFGNAIQSIPTQAAAGSVVGRDISWCARALHESVENHDDAAARRMIEEWEADPKCFPLGNFDGASIAIGSSPRFPMFDNDFGWGSPLAIRSGSANKYDGKVSAFPGQEGAGSIDLEVVLSPAPMFAIERDPEFMEFVYNSSVGKSTTQLILDS